MHNAARLAFIEAGVDELEGLTDGQKEDLVYELSLIPSVSIDHDGDMSFTAVALSVAPGLTTNAQTPPTFTGG